VKMSFRKWCDSAWYRMVWVTSLVLAVDASDITTQVAIGEEAIGDMGPARHVYTKEVVTSTTINAPL